MPPARPGLIVAARRAATVRAIRAGGRRDQGRRLPRGGRRGPARGSRCRGPEAAGGISVCGSAEQDVLSTSFQLIHAAVRRRKPVLAVDLTRRSGPAGTAGRGLRRGRGAAAGVRRPRRAAGRGCPGLAPAGLLRAFPARRSRRGGPSLVMAMISWDGPGRQYRRSCAAYLEDVFELLDAAPGDPRVPVLDEVIHLLNPTAMRARMEYVPAAYPRRDALAERTRVSMSLINAEPATIAAAGAATPRTAGLGVRPLAAPDWPGPAAEIDLGRPSRSARWCCSASAAGRTPPRRCSPGWSARTCWPRARP